MGRPKQDAPLPERPDDRGRTGGRAPIRKRLIGWHGQCLEESILRNAGFWVVSSRRKAGQTNRGAGVKGLCPAPRQSGFGWRKHPQELLLVLLHGFPSELLVPDPAVAINDERGRVALNR